MIRVYTPQFVFSIRFVDYFTIFRRILCRAAAHTKQKKELFTVKKRESKAMKGYPDITSTSSATETTGMMPTPPLTEDQFEAYQELSGMEIPKKGGRK